MTKLNLATFLAILYVLTLWLQIFDDDIMSQVDVLLYIIINRFCLKTLKMYAFVFKNNIQKWITLNSLCILSNIYLFANCFSAQLILKSYARLLISSRKLSDVSNFLSELEMDEELCRNSELKSKCKLSNN